MRGTHAREELPINGKEVSRKMFAGLVATRALYSLAAGMILIFIPVYIYKLSGLWLLAVWLMLSQLADFATVKVNAMVIARIGYKKSVLLGQILWAGGLIFIIMAKHNLWFLVPAGMAILVAQDMFWISNHLLFLMTSAAKFGKKSSLMDIVCMWSGVVGPIIGGVFAANSGFSQVFGIGAILMLSAAIPILILEPDNLEWDFHLKHYWQKIGSNWFSRDLLAFMGLGIEDVMYNFFWPVFLLIVLKNSYTDLGVYKTVILAVTTVIEWLVGRRIDQGGIHKYMMGASGMLMVMWILRGQFHNPVQLLGLDMIDGWVGILVWLPFTVYTYRRATLADKSLYVVEREASIRFGKVVAGILMGIMIAYGWQWERMVWVGVLGLGLMNLLPKIGAKHFEALRRNGK